MTIEIDDSGTGDIIGPAFILFWRRETNTLITKEVPLKLYQNSDFNNKTKEYIKNLFIDVFEEMDIKKTEEIYLCTGNCFGTARNFLKKEKYNYNDAKIEGYLQDKVEKTFVNYLIKNYHVPESKISTKSGKKRYFDLFYWVAADFPRRKHYVKTGFPKWDSKWKQKAKDHWINKMLKD